jgi:hypothetical protein
MPLYFNVGLISKYLFSELNVIIEKKSIKYAKKLYPNTDMGGMGVDR